MKCKKYIHHNQVFLLFSSLSVNICGLTSSNFVTTRHSLSKLSSSLAAPQFLCHLCNINKQSKLADIID